MNEEAEEIRRNFQQRQDKLRSRIVEYTRVTTSMLQSIYKDVRDINRARDK